MIILLTLSLYVVLFLYLGLASIGPDFLFNQFYVTKILQLFEYGENRRMSVIKLVKKRRKQPKGGLWLKEIPERDESRSDQEDEESSSATSNLSDSVLSDYGSDEEQGKLEYAPCNVQL